MERYQLNQNVSLEGIRRRALEEGEGTKAQRDERIAQFQRFSTLFCEEMRKTESLLTQAAAAPWGHCRLPIAN
jgi:hypothetical protein